jgi:hypothetical protein
MAIQPIETGNQVNDGTGDDLRTAFTKVNANFADLDSQLRLDGSNVGVPSAGSFATVFKTKDSSTSQLQFKTILPGANISLVNDTDNIVISSPTQNTFVSVVTDGGSITANSATTILNIVGGNNASVVTEPNNRVVINVDPVGSQLQSNLSLNGFNIQGSGNINITGNLTALNYTGNIAGENPVPIIRSVYDIDFGTAVPGQYNNAIQFIIANTDYDFGSITSPSELELDLNLSSN